MSWTTAELDRFAREEEAQVIAYRADGTGHRPVTVWVVAARGAVYLRSVYGEQGRWYQRVRRHPDGGFVLGGTEFPVHFEPVDDADVQSAVDDAYRGKYARYSELPSVLSPTATATTLRLDPR